MSDARFQQLLARARKAWREACRFDGISHPSLFVVFTPGNPYAEQYNGLMLELNRKR